ncbi:MAG: hypothetical protein ACI3Z7_04375 [Candidatus Aphodosoma sp.]
MKKRNYFLLLAMMFVTFGLVSCGPDNTGGGNGGDDPDDPQTAEDYKMTSAVYGGATITHYTDFLEFVFNTGDVTFDSKGQVSGGSGNVVIIDMLADVDAKTFYPKAGDYKVGNAVVGSEYRIYELENGVLIPYHPQVGYGCKYAVVENGQVVKLMYAVAGTVKVSGNASKAKFDINLAMEDNDGASENLNVVYEGAMTIANKGMSKDERFRMETTRQTNERWSFQTMSGQIFLAKYGELNQFQLSMETAEQETCHFLFYSTSMDAVPAGTYTIQIKVADKSADRTVGAFESDGKLWVSAPYLGVKGSDGGLTNVWFIESGTITIAANRITFDVKSHFGSTFKGEYNGTVKFTIPGQEAPAAYVSAME